MKKRATDYRQSAAAIFKALGHPTRLGIVERLAEGERCVCILVEEFGGSQATISRHLDVLLKARIVRRRPDGVKMLYALAMPCVLKSLPCVIEALAAPQLKT